VILLADILPTFCVKLTFPWFMHRIPYAFRIFAIVAFNCASFQFVGWFNQLGLKLFGVGEKRLLNLF